LINKPPSAQTKKPLLPVCAKRKPLTLKTSFQDRFGLSFFRNAFSEFRNEPFATTGSGQTREQPTKNVAVFLSQLSAMTKKIAVIGPNGGCSDPELAAALARGKSTTV